MDYIEIIYGILMKHQQKPCSVRTRLRRHGQLHRTLVQILTLTRDTKQTTPQGIQL